MDKREYSEYMKQTDDQVNDGRIGWTNRVLVSSVTNRAADQANR